MLKKRLPHFFTPKPSTAEIIPNLQTPRQLNPTNRVILVCERLLFRHLSPDRSREGMTAPWVKTQLPGANDHWIATPKLSHPNHFQPNPGPAFIGYCTETGKIPNPTCTFTKSF